MNLDILKLVKPDNDEDEKFFRNMESTLKIHINKNEVVENENWIDIVEFTIPYLEKALRNPNKNIVTEEEVVKIELIKKVTVDSIKHLSKNTNLIADWDQETGDVIPSKILNSFKEESFLTYENKFIYTLIKLVDDFIFIRTRNMTEDSFKGKSYQRATYEAKTKINKEKISLNLEYISENADSAKKSGNIEERIRELKTKLKMLKSMEIYQLIDSKKITLIQAPLKMTNVLLKNVNFQYAVKLWQYLSDNFDLKNESKKQKADYEEKGVTKELTNENFYLNYLIFNSLESEENENKKMRATELDPKAQKEMTDNLLERIIEINPEMAEQELKKMIAERYLAIKNRNLVSLKPIENRFRERIDKYLSKVEELRLK